MQFSITARPFINFSLVLPFVFTSVYNTSSGSAVFLHWFLLRFLTFPFALSVSLLNNLKFDLFARLDLALTTRLNLQYQISAKKTLFPVSPLFHCGILTLPSKRRWITEINTIKVRKAVVVKSKVNKIQSYGKYHAYSARMHTIYLQLEKYFYK